ncbi:MAG TPA: DUF6151 family protein [Burkholderiales bacterium]|nr:DUF6151 family protein [Burkholderiales bacterium]
MNHPLRCRCGNLRGQVVLPATTARAVCYCKDCRAFAHFLQRPDDILDAQGGTDIVATPPSHVRFEHGADALACMSLSPRGLLRWYAGCCKTPVGNTPRDRRTHYVGLVAACLAAQPLEPSFGPARVRLNTGSARGPVESTRAGTLLAVMKIMAFMLPARFSARQRDNPFFDAASGEPVKRPDVLSRDEAARLKALP